MKKIPLATPAMHTEERKYIQKAFETNWISPLGPNIDEFENTVAAYVEHLLALPFRLERRRCIFRLF